jgi:hypothetical protein
MGNPNILPIGGGGQGLDPPSLDVLWMVYRLRELGQKLSEEDVKRTGQIGRLEFWGNSDRKLTACLLDPSGYPTLDNLHQARLCQSKTGRVTGGLLLSGKVMSGVTISEVPQTWWCQVYSATPRKPADPVT